MTTPPSALIRSDHEDHSEKNMETRVEPKADSADSPTAASNETPRRFRTEEQLRNVLSMLCHFVWYRKSRPGDHFWSIPVDRERDFDCILSDALDELVEWRAASIAGHPAQRCHECGATLPCEPHHVLRIEHQPARAVVIRQAQPRTITGLDEA